MECFGKRFPNLLKLVKSWITSKTEPDSISRAFWMPDDSCMVCCECNSQFTIFNRRHHCRKCGRIFCAKCTSNSVPVNLYDSEILREEGEFIRVCNSCFKQREDVRTSRNEAGPSSPILDPSLSNTSLDSTKSSGAGNSSLSTAVSYTYSSGAYRQMSYGPAISPSHSVQLENCLDKQDLLIGEGCMDSLVGKGGHPPTQFELGLNRHGEMGACFEYAPINVHPIYLPPPILDFNFQPQDWVQEEADKLSDIALDFFTQVQKTLHQLEEFEVGSHDGNIKVLEGFLKKHREEFEEYIRTVSRKEETDVQPFVDILEINRLQRILLFLSCEWDKQIKFAASACSKGLSTRNKEDLAPRVGRILASSNTSRSGEHAEDLSVFIKTSVSDLYASFNKDIDGALSAYHPENIHTFKELLQKGWGSLFLPMGVNDTVIPIYDDEPTSVIAYALVCADYQSQMSDEPGRESPISFTTQDYGNSYIFQSFDDISLKSFFASIDDINSSNAVRKGPLTVDPLASTKSMHVSVSFGTRYNVTCYYARHFKALRRICCPSELDFIRSLSRCKKWGAQGGKSNVFFAKSLDDRFIIKQVTKTELESFTEFAPEYFKYLTISIRTGSATCLAKILGIYQVVVKSSKGRKETKMDVLVMENLLYGRSVKWLYDLKGSLRSRYNADSSGNNKVLLDQNLIEAMSTSPIFVGNKEKRALERAVWNDTSFLASVGVMDYSLLVGMDENRQELVLGIIDFMRQYTWDKHLETWVKASGILGGPKDASPTVIPPIQYKKRFRKAMSHTYFHGNI